MPKILAIEWDDKELRAVVGSGSASNLLIEQIEHWAIPSEVAGSTEKLSQFVANLAAQHGWKKLRTLVSIGRSQVELKELQLPPAPDDELPDMVRFLAMREFNNLGEDSPLDYVTIPGAVDTDRSVIAAALPANTLKQIRQVCNAAGLQLDQIVLRPCAAAALLNEHSPEPMQVRLLVDLLPHEIDLTMLTGSTPEFMRTARLLTDYGPAEAQRQVVNEVRRTIAAASNRLLGRRIDKLVLCGTGASQSLLAEYLDQEIKLPVELFDPFQGCQFAGNADHVTLEARSHFAPLVGLILAATRNHAPLLDFVHPHRKPEPPNQTRTWSLAATLAVCVLLALGYWAFTNINNLNQRISDLQASNAALNAVGKGSTERKAFYGRVEVIDSWLKNKVQMTEELEQISSHLLSNKEIIMDRVTFITVDKKGPVFTLYGNAKKSETITQLVKELEELNDQPTDPQSKSTKVPQKQYKVQLQANTSSSKNKDFPYQFRIEIVIDTKSPMIHSIGPVPDAAPKPAAPPINKVTQISPAWQLASNTEVPR